MLETSNSDCLWTEQTFSALIVHFQLCTMKLDHLFFNFTEESFTYS